MTHNEKKRAMGERASEKVKSREHVLSLERKCGMYTATNIQICKPSLSFTR